MAGLSVTLADWGRSGDAEAVYAEMLARARRQYMPPALFAVSASAAGSEDEVICHAREAFEIRDPARRLYFSKQFAYSRRLYAYPRFRELLSEVGFE